MTRHGILTGGTWCVDHNRLLDRWPQQDEVAEIIETVDAGGGSGHNLAVDIKKLAPAIAVATIALIGNDADGALLRGEARKFGIDATRMQITDAAPTHFTEAYTARHTGRRTHITCRGTADLLTPGLFDFASASHRILHLGLPGVHRLMDAPTHGEANGWVAVLKQARAAGLLTNLEVCSVPPERLAALVRPCLPHLDLLIVNEREIAAIAGDPVSGAEQVAVEALTGSAKTVLARGVMQLVVVHFPMGAVVVDRAGAVVAAPSVNVPLGEIVGANGAGDAFAAGFLYGFHQGWPLADGLALAHAAAAASLRSMSTTGSLEPWQECLKLADSWGWRQGSCCS